MDIKLYPNPANNMVSIIGDNSYATAKIFDIGGSLLSNQLIIDNAISTAQLPNGIYIIELTDSNNKIVRVRVLIQH